MLTLAAITAIVIGVLQLGGEPATGVGLLRDPAPRLTLAIGIAGVLGGLAFPITAWFRNRTSKAEWGEIAQAAREAKAETA